MILRPVLWALVALFLERAQCGFDLSEGDDSDLTHFMSRPDIKAPRYDVIVHDPDRLNPGMLFVAPYGSIYQEKAPPRYYKACQTGPHIYDSFGNLVWGGACERDNQNVADFRVVRMADGTQHLSGIELGLNQSDSAQYGDGKTRGYGFLLDQSYSQHTVIRGPKNMDSFNMHELRLVDGGVAALHILWKPEYIDVSSIGLEDREAGWVGNMGFREVEIASGKTLFEWWSLDHIPLEESTWGVADIEGPAPNAWDYLHIDSVDKGPDGNYLVSARHTDTVYKISSADRSILWRLGGNESSFEQVGFRLTRQHDARSTSASTLGLSAQKDDDSVEYISVFDNGSDEHVDEPPPSAALVLRLDPQTSKATIVRRIPRPDGAATLYSGNHEAALANGNVFVGWGENGFFTEHGGTDGRLVVAGQFASERFATYRIYKGEWIGKPSRDELALVCYAWGTTAAKATTVCYVSWNGATEVRRWRFYGVKDGEAVGATVAEKTKNGFETIVQVQGYFTAVHTEALDGEGNILVASDLETVEVPRHWPGKV